MQTSEHIDKLAPALVQVQTHAGPALKQSNNPAFKSKYADLASCWEAVREPLAKAQIFVMQEAALIDAGVSVTTRLLHASGQWLQTDPLIVPLGKRDAHGLGSAITYGKRYSLSAALGIVADDDDGNAAVQPAKAQPSIDADAYGQWKDDLMAVAGEGVEALKQAWSSSPLEFRQHLMKVPADAAWWAKLKASAEKGA
jgi:hypothetical protein